MSEWYTILVIVVVAFVVGKFYQQLIGIRADLQIAQSRMISLRDERSESEDGVQLKKVMAVLDHLVGRLNYPLLVSPYPLETVAYQRARCAYLYRRLAETERVSAEVRTKVYEEDAAQFHFLYRQLTLMLQANRRVASGDERIEEARERVAGAIGREPFSGAEMGNGCEYWKTEALVESFLRYGLALEKGGV